MSGLPTLDLLIFLLGAFAGAFVTGLAGFAFGMVAAAVWLHALPAHLVPVLIVGYALLLMAHATWKLRHAVKPMRLAPFILGSAVGLPGGILLLRVVSAGQLRTGVAVLLIGFSLYNLRRPAIAPVKGEALAADASVGVMNGVMAGATGLGGILPTIWSSLRGWTRDEQRAVFQPTAFATFAMTLLAFAGTGMVSAEATWLFVIGLPVLALGAVLGWKAYGRLDEAAFRKLVLVLLLASGVLLLATGG